MLDRTGRLVVRRRRAVLLLWLVLLVAGLGGGGAVFGRLVDAGGGDGYESVQAWRELREARPTGPRVVGVVDGVDPAAPAVVEELAAATADLRALDGVAAAYDGATVPDPRLRAEDGRALLVVVDLEKDLPDARFEAAVDGVVERLRAVDVGEVRLGGGLLLNREISAAVEQDLKRGELVTLPIALVVMVVVFGGLVAAGLPVLAAVGTVAVSLLVLLGASTVLDLNPDVVSVVTVLGLGLAIDYGLLLVSRFREERAGGLAVHPAVERTVATAGRTVAFSALTVAVSLSGLFVFEDPQFKSFGAAGVAVVVTAALAALTLTPALLATLGRRISVPERLPSDDGRFARLARRVQRRPLLVAGAVGAVLLAAGAPFLTVEYRDGGPDLLPRSFETRQVADALETRFPGREAEPVTVVGSDPALLERADELAALPGVRSVRAQEGLAEGTYALDVVPAGESQSGTAKDLVHELRALFDDARVTGDAAFLVDFQDGVTSRAPWALALVAGATFVLLFLMTGSVLVPAKALVMNTLSLGASFGALVLVFQHGWLADLLGVDPPGGLEVWVPVLVFVFAFGLSMDYEVFLLSRIQELHRQGYDNDTAVALGLQRSGRVITSAALLLVIVFAGFAAGRMLGIKELGLALAIAVAVDATLVRCLLVPATMTLLGDRNWWAPAPLRRLHDRIGLVEAPSAPLPAQRAPADELAPAP